MTTGGPSHRAIATMTSAERPAGLTERPRIGAGDQVGRYIVERELGRGGMGVVYEAMDPSLQRRIALKVVRPDESDPESTERMMREARAMAALAHPNVVAIHDVGVTGDGQIFVAMELIDGQTLGGAMREGRPALALLDLFLQAGRGLAAAHAVGLVHRDFKPENVLVGRDGRARVTDFGLAPGDSSSGPAEPGRPKTLTAAGPNIGTPAYLAPERHIGAPASALADQFSFAVALYEALAGERPFQGTYDEMQMAKLGSGRMPWPAYKAIPPLLTHTVDRALSRDPGARYPSMPQFLAALEACTVPSEQGSPPRASGPSTAMSAPLSPGANPQYLNTRPAPAVYMAPPPPPKSDRTIWYVLGGVALLLVFGAIALVIGAGVWARQKTKRMASSPLAVPTEMQVIPLPGPMPKAPRFTPVVPGLHALATSLPCPTGTTFHRDDAPVVALYCVDATNTKQGPFAEFDRRARDGRLIRHGTYSSGKLTGTVWVFSTGIAQSVTEYEDDLKHGADLKLGLAGTVVTQREYYSKGQKDGLSEYWNVGNGAGVSAQLYRKGQLVGISPEPPPIAPK